MEQTKYFKDCVVIAQARVIEGKKTPPHICTIVWDLIDNNFIRITCPFSLKEKPLKRWKRFSFFGDKENVIAGDTREETWGINNFNLFPSNFIKEFLILCFRLLLIILFEFCDFQFLYLLNF